jgi:hypothetical protein
MGHPAFVVGVAKTALRVVLFFTLSRWTQV